MKTKFIKVSVQEILPEKAGFYFTLSKIESKQIGYFNGVKFNESFIDACFWLEEIVDREGELADVLQDAINLIDELPYDEKLQETRGNLCMNAQSLIFYVKKNAPDLLDPR